MSTQVERVAARTGRADPASEAWALMHELLWESKSRFAAVSQEIDISPPQFHALRLLEPGSEIPMRALAQSLFCDASNVTGIVDRLEARGLIERRSATHDRRVKMLALTPEGEAFRERMLELLFAAPPALRTLSKAEQRELRDLMRRALGRD
jgi:DNA-binding MarR family transcriptional regulator